MENIIRSIKDRFNQTIKTTSQRKEAGELPRFPVIDFQISRKGADQQYTDVLQNASRQFEVAWRAVEGSIMSTFEEATNSHWPTAQKEEEIPVTFTGIEGSYSRPLRLGVRDMSPWARQRKRVGEVRDTVSLMGSFIHELSHNFMHRRDLEFVTANFADRIDLQQLKRHDEDAIRSVCKEVYAELVWKDVVDRCFPPERVYEWLQRRRVGHQGVYDLIGKLSDEERKMIVDREFREERVQSRSQTLRANKQQELLQRKLQKISAKPLQTDEQS